MPLAMSRLLVFLAVSTLQIAPIQPQVQSTLSQILGSGGGPPPSPPPQQPSPTPPPNTPAPSPPRTPAPTTVTPAPSTSTPSPSPSPNPSPSPSPTPTPAPGAGTPPTTGGATGAAAQGFIRVSGGQFVDGACRQFLFTGWNSWRLVDAALNEASALPQDKSVLGGDSVPTYLFKQANSLGLTVMRFFGTPEVNLGQGSVLQPSPGVYNEPVFKAIDYIISEAGKYNIKLIIAFIDYWQVSDGVQQYVNWCAGGNKDAFFTSSSCQDIYKNHVTHFLNRVNTYNNLAYKNDPTIFAFDLLNEPRQSSGDSAAVDNWIGMMAAHFKSVDTNHLLTVGEEGFFVSGDPHASANPAGGWAGSTGQDFTKNMAHPQIDFYAIHCWPDNWKVSGTDFVVNWLNAHADVAKAAGKPLIVEEFGKVVYYDTSDQRTSVRNPYFQAVYDTVQNSINTGGPIKGDSFWEWTVRGHDETLDVSLPNGLHPYGVTVWDETFQGPVKAHAQFIASKTGGVVAGCSASGSSPAATSAAG